MELEREGLSMIINNVGNVLCDNKLYEKNWFILCNYESQKDYKRLERLSDMWLNIKYKRCEYDSNKMRKIERMKRRMYRR